MQRRTDAGLDEPPPGARIRRLASLVLAGSEAVHLAGALAGGTTDLVVAVWGPRLHAVAVAERLAVAPRLLDA